jgi:hypothetical protein
VAAPLFLVATLNVGMVVVFPLWVLALNGIIWLHTRTIAQESAASVSRL